MVFMPKERNAKGRAQPKIDLVDAKRVSETEVIGAFKEAAKIPEETASRVLWEDNGAPTKKSPDEMKAARDEAVTWAQDSFSKLSQSMHTNPEITLLSAQGSARSLKSEFILKSLTMARAHENIGYLFSASAMYLQIVDTTIIDRHNINSGTLKWARELADHSQNLYRTHISGGGYDNEFSPLWEDLRYTNQMLNSLEKLRPRDFSEVNFIMDDLLTSHATGIKKEHLDGIEYQIFAALLKQKSVAANELNAVAFDLASASEQALESGGKDLAQKLYAMAKATFTRYKRWQMAEGIVPNTTDRISLRSDSRMHDHLLVHKALSRLESRLDES